MRTLQTRLADRAPDDPEREPDRLRLVSLQKQLEERARPRSVPLALTGGVMVAIGAASVVVGTAFAALAIAESSRDHAGPLAALGAAGIAVGGGLGVGGYFTARYGGELVLSPAPGAPSSSTGVLLRASPFALSGTF